MNFEQSSALLKKINVLHDSASAFGGQMSRMERDLLMQYLRDLYEVLADDGQPVRATKQPTYTPPEPVVTRPVVPTPAPEPVRVAEPVRVVETPRPEPVVERAPEPVTVPSPLKVEIDDAIVKLFDIKESQEIGSRLSRLPISDISKAMGINDRILIKNDLFGGDQGLMDSTLTALNSMASFDKAKEYLMEGVATDQKWAKNSRSDRAKSFIQLVNRRFL